MTVTFHADASSFQGSVNWPAVKAAGFGGGSEKVSQGTTYANPYWPAARAALAALAGPEFTPGAYHYLTAGNGAAQADWFARQAGAIPGFVIWCDLERAAAGAQPSVADARAFAARVRQHYPGKRVGLYAAESFTGAASLTFADMLWSPHYVTGSGSPAALYQRVPASWWNAYGGLSPLLLQFSQSAPVPGVGGLADVSAYRGTPAELHDALLGIRPAPKPVPAAHAWKDPEPMLMKRGAGAVTPLSLPSGATKIVLTPEDTATVGVQTHDHGTNQVDLAWQPPGGKTVPIPGGVQFLHLHRIDAGLGDVSVIWE